MMMKHLFILILTAVTMPIYGQITTFQENDNYDARELKQIFNKEADSLILKSETIIRQVDIFNENFIKSFLVNDYVSKIDLSILPSGEFIVQARLRQKRIIMYIFRSGVVEEKPLTLTRKKASHYWVVYEINSGSGSNKKMSLEKEDVVNRLISKHKLEVNTTVAKNNRLTIYEVYNPSKFMREQLRKPAYFKSSNSTIFNVVPYYSTGNMIHN